MPKDLVELVRYRAEQQPNAEAFVFLTNGEIPSGRLTFVELEYQARAVAGFLQNRGVVAGERVVIACSNPQEYLPAFFGCLFAGAIAVPACSPKNAVLRDRLGAIVKDANPSAIIGDEVHSMRGEPPKSPEDIDLPWIIADEAIRSGENPLRLPNLAPDSIAILQYSSGSTSAPKGIVLQHQHIVNNQRMIQSAFKTSRETVVVSWLPLYHDMGLMGAVVHPVQVGCKCVLMSPEAFMQSPKRWLQAITTYGGTVSGAPNFAYELCARRISSAQRVGLDLDSWKTAFNGSEVVNPDTLRAFTERFSAVGFRLSSFVPCYGLAEATLLVTACKSQFEPKALTLSRDALAQNSVEVTTEKEGRAIVGCGASPELEVLIVDPETCRVCPPGSVGEIWLAGSSIAAGYWNQPELTRLVFAARCAENSGAYLRTGDLGFLTEGNVFVTGRLKDLVIVRGENYNAEDFEVTVRQAHSALDGTACAVFGTEVAGTEELVVVAEVAARRSMPLDAIAASIRAAIAVHHQMPVHTIVLVRRGAIPRTSSGKIRRGECQAILMKGRMPLLGKYEGVGPSVRQPTAGIAAIWAADDQSVRRALVLEYLRYRVANAVKVPEETVTVLEGLSHLGIDSLKAAELQARVTEDLGVNIRTTAFLDGQCLRDLSEQIASDMDLHGKVQALAKPLFNVQGIGQTVLEFPLSQEQERLHLIEHWSGQRTGLNLTVAFRLKGNLNPAALQKALNRVIGRHLVLHSRFVEREGSLVAQAVPDAVLASGLEPVALDTSLDNLLEIECQRPFNLADAPLVRARVVQDSNSQYLIVTLPHIISDAWSFGILARELTTFYGEDEVGTDNVPDIVGLENRASAPVPRTSVPDGGTEAQLSYWRSVLSTELPRFEWLCKTADSAADGTGTIRFEIPNSLAAVVDALARDLECTPFIVLLAAFEALLSQLSRSQEVAVGIPVRGRNPVTESVIGLYAHPVPLRSSVKPDFSFVELVAQTRERVLGALTNQDVPFAQIAGMARTSSQGRFLLPVMFTVVSLPSAEGRSLELEPCAMHFANGGCEAFLTLYTIENKVRGILAYDQRTVRRSRAALFCSNYVSRLEACIADARRPLGQLPPPEREASDSGDGEINCVIGVTSTFTAGPIDGLLRLWLDRMQLPVSVCITPAGQVLQQLLDPNSELGLSNAAFNVHLIRVSDIYWRDNDQDAGHSVDEFASAIKAFSTKSGVPNLVCICPSSMPSMGESEIRLRDAERQLADKLGGFPNLSVLTAADVASVYPLSDALDPLSDRLAGLPYSREFFAALASMIMRRAYLWHHFPPKAIVVDADNTLWDGACGEDGAACLRVGREHRQLQEFLEAQRKAGALLCLCSRNRDEDIDAAFGAHPGMPLQLLSFVARRVNQLPKSENLKSLAQQLHISLDACLFIDDDPVECAEVSANCTGVRVLRLDSVERMETLNRIWDFDRSTVTAEDESRSAFYSQETTRERARGEAPSLNAFFESLQLEVNVDPIATEHLARVSQLTLRTNQFNCTGVRHTEAELAALVGQSGEDGLTGLVVHARDRFGDYGLIGALSYRIHFDGLYVSWWSLSCRALNRGVEHRILAHLGACAIAGEVPRVVIDYRKTAQNEPARMFLSQGSNHIVLEDGHSQFIWSADGAASCKLSICRNPVKCNPESETVGHEARDVRSVWNGAVAPVELQMMDAAGIARVAAEYMSRNRQRQNPPSRRPETPTERRLLRIWADLLGVEDLDVTETLYSAGGQSLTAIQMLSRIRDEFGIELPIMSIFTGDLTIVGLAAAIDLASLAEVEQATLQEQITEIDRLTDDEVTSLLESEDV